LVEIANMVKNFVKCQYITIVSLPDNKDFLFFLTPKWNTINDNLSSTTRARKDYKELQQFKKK